MKTSHTRLYDTDVFMKKLYTSLVRDFRSVMGSEYREGHLMALRRGVPLLRDLPSPARHQAPPYIFKMEAQLDGLFKRYRFKADTYTDKQLQERTFQKFMDNQIRLAKHDWKPLRSSTFAVVQRARKIVKDILSSYSPSEFEGCCKFSTRATVGNAARDAYIDHKLADPITGSPEHIKWFKSHLRRHGYLSSVLAQCSPLGEPCFEICESLPLVGVPKSFKSLRLISPNTLIGSYYTYGLGRIFVKALKDEGLDIARLQNRHKALAKRESIFRKLVTADLTNASESFLWTLIARLTPRKWLKALGVGRLKYYHTDDGSRYNYCSFMAMGIGFTFPLQTLLFYALIKSIRELLGVKGLISVYGDDLIYPRKIHGYVESVFADLGFQLNKDKTFVETNFRESCGGDFYHGVDVRPFSPEGAHQQLRPKKYEAWLYQMINGLLSHWDETDIPLTVRLVKLEILNVTWLVRQVPPSFPDYSGWRTESPVDNYLSGFAPILVRFRNGSREYVVSHLTQVASHRYVSFEEAYLYDWLRAKWNDEEDTNTEEVFESMDFTKWMERSRLKRSLKLLKRQRDNRDSIYLVKHPSPPKRYRSINGKRLQKAIATTTCKLEPQKIQTNVTDSISDWI